MNEHHETDGSANPQTGVTGIDFLDRFLPQSATGGRVYGLLGPIGVGKSTLGVMIAVEGAKAAYARRQSGQPGEVWIYVNLDGGRPYIQERIISHAAKISRNRPLRHSVRQNQSVIGYYHPYEVERQEELPKTGGVLLGERERFDEFRSTICDQELHLVHLGSTHLPKDEPPARIIARDVERFSDRWRIAGVVIDYVGVAARDYIELDAPPWKLSREISNFVADSREHIAEQWGCPVWLVHQLNGVANTSPSGTVQHHHNASECCRFADNLDVCMTLGTWDRNTHAFQIACTKSPIEPPGPMVLQFDPDFATLRIADNLRVDRTSRRIVETRNPIHFDPTFDFLVPVDE